MARKCAPAHLQSVVRNLQQIWYNNFLFRDQLIGLVGQIEHGGLGFDKMLEAALPPAVDKRADNVVPAGVLDEHQPLQPIVPEAPRDDLAVLADQLPVVVFLPLRVDDPVVHVPVGVPDGPLVWLVGLESSLEHGPVVALILPLHELAAGQLALEQFPVVEQQSPIPVQPVVASVPRVDSHRQLDRFLLLPAVIVVLFQLADISLKVAAGFGLVLSLMIKTLVFNFVDQVSESAR